MTASQKTIMIVGVPEPARNRNAVDSVVKIEPTIATSDLNQRLSSRITNKPVNTAIMIDGSLMEYKDMPNNEMLAFWIK